MNLPDIFKDPGNPFLYKLGEKAQRYKDELNKGELTQAEYDDLCKQLTNLEQLEKDAREADVKLEVAEVAQVLIAFLSHFV